MEPSLQPASAANLNAILDFSQRLNEEDPAFTGGIRFNREAVQAALEQLLADPSLGQVWLIYAGSQPAGYVVLTYSFSLESYGRDALIDELYITPAHRSQGLGRWVIDQLAGFAQSTGATRLYLEVERPNSRAQAFYHRLGFEDHNRYLLSKWLK
jgi:GNAT superfamily N-acetyltransferase